VADSPLVVAAVSGYPTGCTPDNPCPAHGGKPDSDRFRREFLGGTPVADFLIRELTDPDSPEFEGRSHGEKSQRARSVALMAATGVKPENPAEARALRGYLEDLLGRNLVEEGRAWLADLQWEDEPDFAAMTDAQILRGIDRYYDGGWKAFIKDGEPG
jgi:hypothetical protein